MHCGCACCLLLPRTPSHAPSPPLTPLGTHWSVRIPVCRTRVAVTGALKGYDQLVNMVLDDCTETLRGAFSLVSIYLHHPAHGRVLCRADGWPCAHHAPYLPPHSHRL